jgi:CheY-like chemotaxis protein
MEALNKEQIQCRVSLVRDGEEAMEFVHQNGRYARAPRPDIVLLDMNLPKLDGRGVLSLLKKDQSLSRIPVVVLTASHEHQEILESENLHVESFLTKPVDLEEFISVVKSLRKYLLEDVILPQ